MLFTTRQFGSGRVGPWVLALRGGLRNSVFPAEEKYELIAASRSFDDLKRLLNGEQSDLLCAVENAEKLRSRDDFNGMVIVGAAKRVGIEVLSFDKKMREKVGE